MLLSHFSTLRLYLLPKSKHYEFYHLSLHDALPIFARSAWLAAGGSEAVPGTTIDRQCGSGEQAIHFATQAVMSGTADLVVAGGVQNMSTIPLGTANSNQKDQGYPDTYIRWKAW